MKKEILDKIVPYLIINTSYCESLGLFHGKMGTVLFFAHYAHFIKNDLYDDFAGEILNEVLNKIHVNLPIDFEYGYCGIGWGIEYLIRHNFLEEEEDILSDIDSKIMERDPLRINDLSFKNGLAGILFYVLTRCTNRFQTNIFDKAYLEALCQRIKDVDISLPYLMDKELIYDILQGKRYIKELDLYIPKSFYGILPQNITNIQSIPLGMENGISGIGLCTILENKQK